MTKTALLALVTLLASGAAHAQDSIRWRGALPLDGRGIDAVSAAAPGTRMVRIALSGTMSCSIDGSEIDALSRFVGTLRDDATGPFVRLPRDARLISSDPASHRYVFEIPADATEGIALDIAPIAARYLITPTEARSSLIGAIEVEVLDPPVPLAGYVGLERAPASTLLPLGLIAGGVAGIPLLFGLGALVRRRRRSRPELALISRAERARAAIRRESDALGLAFVEVATSGERLFDSARAAAHHVEQLRDASRRTKDLTSTSAEERRAEIRVQQTEALARLSQIVDRLEGTAARLAAHRADHARVRNVEATVTDLASELETALSADTEAQQI
jgi:hypothetical protein